MILSGDVGGTKTRLALYEERQGELIRKDIERFDSKAFASLEIIVQTFLKARSVKVDCACFGIPGPVVDGAAKTTNLPWLLSEKSLSQATGIPKVRLVNDLVSTTAAIPHFGSAEVETLHQGKPRGKNAVCAVLAPGTGTGQGYLVAADGKYHALASEGGHVDFSPIDEIQIGLLRYLQKKFGRVSLERVLCGPGLVAIYNFLRDEGIASEPDEIRERIKNEDPAAVIASTGQAEKYEITLKALDIFVSILGAQAGNLVLTYMATGGLYLGGGIPPKILEKLSDGRVVGAYLNKGRLTPVVKDTSLFVIKDDHASVLGAAYLGSVL